MLVAMEQVKRGDETEMHNVMSAKSLMRVTRVLPQATKEREGPSVNPN